MFTFHWSELLVVVLSSLALFFVLALLMLRRRYEILQKWLTPKEPDLPEEFFRVRKVQSEEKKPVEDAAEESETEAEPDVQWGTQESES